MILAATLRNSQAGDPPNQHVHILRRAMGSIPYHSGLRSPPPRCCSGKTLDVPMALERPSPPKSFSAGQAPPTSKTKPWSTTARQLQMDDQPFPQEQATGIVDHHHNAVEPWFPTRTGYSSDASLDAEGFMSLGPRNEYPDQSTCDPSSIQGALPSLELEANTIPPSNIIWLGQESVPTTENTLLTPPEASIEPPTQTARDSTSTPTDNHALGSPGTIGHTTDRSDKGLSKKDCTCTNSKSRKPLPLQEDLSMTASAPHAVLNHSTFLTGIDESTTPRERCPGPPRS